MIVLLTSRVGFYGGVEKHVYDLAKGLRGRGHAVSLVHGAARGQEVERFSEAFDAVVAEDRSASLFASARAVYAHKLSDASILDRVPKTTRLAVAVHDHDFTCVRSHRYLPGTLEPCVRPPGTACIVHGCVVIRSPESLLRVRVGNPFRLAAETRRLSEKATMVAASAFIRRTLLDAGVSAEQVSVIHPVPPEDTAPLVPAPAEHVIGFVGQVIRGKGLDVLLSALALLPVGRLIVAGTGNGLPEAQTLAVKLGLEKRVEFVGSLPPEEVRRIYDRCRVLAVPSRWPEPFGMIGIEAMRRGRPVVGAWHGGIPEWLAHGETGYGFRPTDVNDLAVALTRALSAENFEGLAQGALARAKAFSYEGMLDAVEQHFTL